MKKPWETFEENYTAVEETDPDTGRVKIRYAYCGPWFVCRNGEAPLKKAKACAAAAMVINIASALWAGVQPSGLNQAGLTSVPYGLSLAALVFSAAGTICLLLSAQKVKRPDYERMNRLLSVAPPVQAVLLLLAFLAGVVLLINGEASFLDTWPMAGYLLSGGAAAFLYSVYRVLQYRQEKNTEFEFAEDVLTSSIRMKSEVE